MNKQHRESIHWRDLNIKDKIAISTAIAAFIIGWGLSIAAFIVPPLGTISEGVLWILGQSLVYAASVFGIAGYFSTETLRMKRDLREYMDNRLPKDEIENRYDNNGDFSSTDIYTHS